VFIVCCLYFVYLGVKLGSMVRVWTHDFIDNKRLYFSQGKRGTKGDRVQSAML